MSKAENRLNKFLSTPEYKVIDSDKITSSDNLDAYLPVADLINLAHDINHKTLEDVEEWIDKTDDRIDKDELYKFLKTLKL